MNKTSKRPSPESPDTERPVPPRALSAMKLLKNNYSQNNAVWKH